MRKPVKILLALIGAAILLAVIAYCALLWFITPDIPEPKSDVPIEYKIGWWAYQENLKITSLTSEVVFNGLNLFNGTALVQYNNKGSVSYKNTW